MTQLNNILEQQQFSDLIVLTSPATLNVEVESVEVSETPDVSKYLPKHVFLLTTAMVYGESPEQLKTLIRSLKDIDAAGLGIKIGRFLQKIPQEVVDYAESIQFALLEIPVSYSLGTVLHKMISFIWGVKQAQLVSAIDIQRKFADLLVDDVSVERFINEVSKTLSIPIILLDPFYDIVTCSHHFNTTVNRAEHYTEQLLTNNKWNIASSKTKVIQDPSGKEISLAVFSVNVNRLHPYYLLILNPQKMPYPLSEVAIEQATVVLSFILLKNQKIEEYIQDRQSGHFRHFIRQQKDASQKKQNWLHLGERFNLIDTNYYQVVYVNSIREDLFFNKVLDRMEELYLISQWLKKKLADVLPDTCVLHPKNRKNLVLLVQHELEDLDALFTSLSQELKDRLGVSLAFSYGKAYNQVDLIATSFLEAKFVYEKAITLDNQPVISYYNAYYNSQDMFNLFEQFNQDKVVYFCQYVLKDLAFPEEDYYIELRGTLKAYLENQCEISRTSKQLYVHRNTVKYRIERCEEILGIELLNPQTNLNVRLALELSERLT